MSKETGNHRNVLQCNMVQTRNRAILLKSLEIIGLAENKDRYENLKLARTMLWNLPVAAKLVYCSWC